MSRRRRRPAARPERLPWDALHPTLDLHGDTAEEAVRRAEAWLLARQAEREQTVRIVTGRGLHSVGPPVLPHAISELLGRLKGHVVEEYTREPGGGAVLVRLIRRATARPVRPPGPGPVSPELARLAEEALAELGVFPTPALIAAEARRILEERARDRS